MREIFQLACVWGIALFGVLSLWPFRFTRGWKSWHLYLPVAGIALYAIYEALLPAQVDVGGEMAIILPLLFFLWLNGMAKVTVLRGLMERAGGSRRRLRSLPQRRLQVAIALPILLGCAVWFWKNMN
jgi:hypothetical protein